MVYNTLLTSKPMGFMKKSSFYLALLVLVLGIGFYLGTLYDGTLVSRSQDNGNHEIREGGYKFINPLLECETNQDSGLINLLSLKKRVEGIVSAADNRGAVNEVAVYFRDLNNGPWFGINEKEKFSPSSMLKVPLMISFYKDSEKNPQILKKTVKTGQILYRQDQFFPPEKGIAPNEVYSIDELINYMIQESDNDAKELLHLYKDMDTYLEVFSNLGIELPADTNEENFMDIQSYASFFRILYNASYLNREMSIKALENLSKTRFNIGLVAGVPKGTLVAHKFGERGNLASGDFQLHDCGIIYHPQKPYLLCLMTRGRDFGQLSGVISDISAAVYKYISSPITP